MGRHKFFSSLVLCLTILVLSTAATAAEPVKGRTEQRQEDLDFLYQKVLVENHPDVFANTPESEFLALKRDIEARLDTASDIEFLLDLMRLTALVKDSHTSIQGIGNLAEAMRYYPFGLSLREGRWYLTAAPAAEQRSLGQTVTAVNGIPTEQVLEAFAPLFSADNHVTVERRFRQYWQLADLYEYLGLAKNGEAVTLSLADGKVLTLASLSYADLEKAELVRLSDQITREPVTAAQEKYYLSMALRKDIYYIQYNTCQEDPAQSMEAFAAQVQRDLDAGEYRRILLDLRNNGGGSDGVIWPLLELLRKEMDQGAELVGLIGPATFSSALINAVEIQEMGGVLVGESAGGSVCHFGAVRSFSLPNSKVRGQLSSKYIDLNTLLDAGAGRGVVALEPDMTVSQTLADTLAGKDTAVEWLLTHPEALTQREYPDAPLTRGRFIGQIYAALGEPDASWDLPPFSDLFGIEWFLHPLNWAAQAGIAKGGADGTFSAPQSVTWQEAAVFLVRTAETQGFALEETRSDPLPAALAGSWAQEQVRRAWNWGLLPAKADFSKPPTRAQGEDMAALLAP